CLIRLFTRRTRSAAATARTEQAHGATGERRNKHSLHESLPEKSELMRVVPATSTAYEVWLRRTPPWRGGPGRSHSGLPSHGPGQVSASMKVPSSVPSV